MRALLAAAVLLAPAPALAFSTPNAPGYSMDWDSTEAFCFQEAGDANCNFAGVSNDTSANAYDFGALERWDDIDSDTWMRSSYPVGLMGSDAVSLSHDSDALFDDPDNRWTYVYEHALVDGFDEDIDWYAFTPEQDMCVDVCFYAVTPQGDAAASTDLHLDAYRDDAITAIDGLSGPSDTCFTLVGEGTPVFVQVWDDSPEAQTPAAAGEQPYWEYAFAFSNASGLYEEVWYPDADGDGFGDADHAGQRSCGPPDKGWVQDHTDCDDDAETGSAVNPAAPEVCNDVDDDCSGVADDGLPTVDWWPDDDDDGFGDLAASPTAFCDDPGAGWADDDTDCDDDVKAHNPDAAETCNGADDDCDGQIDEGLDTTTWWPDDDGDGYGDACSAGTELCADPGDGWAPNDGDCDDASAAVNPGAAEICNLIDDDCDGDVDEGFPTESWFGDLDGDGYGFGIPVEYCTDPGEGWADDDTDCDDAAAGVNPGASEVPYDGIDQDCDGADQCDVDGDGFLAAECGGPDCDDSVAGVNPDATDTPFDGVDSDCDGACDVDGDGDGHLDPGADTAACPDLPADDCDDTDPTVTVCYPEPDRWVQGGLLCSAAGAPAGAWLLLPLLLVARRRR